MRLTTRASALAAILAAGFVASCDAPTTPPTTGLVAPRFVLVRDDNPRAIQPLDAMVATVTGTNFSQVVNLTLSGATWTGEAVRVPPGTYAITVEGLVSNQVQHYATVGNVTVVAGRTAEQLVPVAQVVPTITPPTLSNTTAFSQTITFTNIPSATGYEVQLADNAAFTNATTLTATGASLTVTVPTTGTWHLRSRPTIAGLVRQVMWSDAQTFQVFSTPVGRLPGQAELITPPVTAPDTIADRNITPTDLNGWYRMSARAGDSLFAETRAARLTPASPLNTDVTIFRADGTTQVATNDNITGSTDSRAVGVAPATEDYLVRVTRAAGTVGHYELILEIRRLPAVATGFTAVANSATAVTLGWSDNADNETSYRIERCQTPGCSTFTEIGSTGANANSYADNGLTTGESYTYRIRARNTVGNSAYVGPLTVALAGPTAPGALTATTISGSRVDLAWSDNSDNETSFQIERCTVAPSANCTNGDFSLLASVPAGSTTYANTGVAIDGTYTYRIRAVNAVAPAAKSATATANTIRPAAATGLAATTMSATRIDLTWTDASTNETGFRIERCTGLGCSSFATLATVGAGLQSYSDLTAAFDTYYGYRVFAVNVAGDAPAASNTATANTKAPGAPSALASTTVSASRVDLSWTDTTTAETGFVVERCTGAGCSGFAVVATLPPGTSAFTDNGVSAGNNYRYQVKATGVAGDSPYAGPILAPVLLPAAPSALTATTISGTQVNLAWTDNADNEITFRVERCTGAGCSSFAEIATVTANTSSYSDVSTVAENVYQYRVRAVNQVGNSAYTAAATASTEGATAPTALLATTVSSSQVDLSWTDNSGNETGFRIERCTGAGCSSFSEIATVGASVTSYQNTGIGAGALYTYRVRAYNVVGNSAYTNTATATTGTPAAATALAATTLGATQIDLAWTDNATGELGYIVERCDFAGCSGTDFAVLDSIAANATAFSDLTAAVGNDYRYRVRGYNVIGAGAYSNEATANTRVPVDPSGLAAVTMSGTRIDLSWTDNADNETAYQVWRCVAAACPTFTQIATLGANVTAYQDNTVAVDQSYTYHVIAVNIVGASNPSGVAIGSTLLPASPSGVSALTQSATAILVAWTDNAIDANGFVVQRCTGGGCVDFADLDSTTVGVFQLTDNSVTLGNQYRYRVLARNVAGRSAPSGEADANTNVPGAPSVLTATTQSNTRIDLAWTDNATDEVGFYIERCAGVGCATFAVVDSVGADVVAYASLGLTASTAYSFQVRAYNLAGPSAASNVASATTNLPAIPTALTAEAVSTTQIQLQWLDNADNETGYEVESCTGAGCNAFSLLQTLAANATGVPLTGLSAGTTYRFRVRATNAAGASDYSDVAQATTSVPAAPTTLTGNATSTTTAAITWDDAADNETRYVIERCTGAGCVAFVAVDSVAANVITFTDLTLSAGNEYGYRVMAVNTVGNSTYSPVLYVSTVLPTAPSDLTAQTISATQIDLAWTDNATNESAYVVERCQGVACSNFAGVDTLPPNTATFQDIGLTPNLTFRYRVKAINDAGSSAYTAVVNAATDVPADPSALTALATGSTSIRIDWVDNANNETDFVVQRCMHATCAEVDYADIQLLGANITTYTDATLASGDTATYRVKAINLNGESRFSNTATATTTLPGDPTDLVALTVSGTRIDLAWTDKAANETGYEIERCTGAGCSGFARIDSVGPDATTYMDASVSVNGEYTYRVRAVNLVGLSGYTLDASANTMLPAAASGLSATTVSATQVNLLWTDNATNELGFRIERCAGAGCSDFTMLVAVGPDAFSYSDLATTLGNSYSYRVFAYNVSGDAAASATATATTLLPADPNGLVATVLSATSIRVDWTDHADNEDGYTIERCTGAGCSSYVQVAVVGANVTQFDNTGLNASTFYRYRIRGFNAAGTSQYSEIITANTFGPTAPNSLTATTVFGDRVDLAWTDNSTNETGFRIERCAGAACSDFLEVATTAANVTSYQNTGLSFGTAYRWRVRSYNGVANSAYSNIADGNTNVPLDPSALAAEAASTTQINLNWTDNASNETGFRLERCAGVGCSDFALIQTLAANATAYSDTPVAAATSFTYRIRAFNAGESGYSNTATATTILPADPSTLTALAVAGDRVDLTWTDNADNEYGFRIERCQGAACSGFTEVAVVAANVQAYSDNGLANGIVYRYRLRAYNGAGTSGYTNEAEGTTNVPGIPSALTATTMTATQINLAWTDNATDELGFVIERCIGSGCTDFAVHDTVATPDANFYSDVGLTASTAYRYRVRAYNASGVSGASNEAAASTNTPADPTGLTATTQGPTSIQLAWTDNADNELGYEVERCTGAACSDFVQIGNLAPNVDTFNDGSAVVDQQYRYRVRAVNNAGSSNYTSVADANTLRPADPTTLVATTVSATEVNLTWADNADNEATYRVERCAGSGCSSFVEIASLPAGSTGLSDDGLTPSTIYRYRVRAANIAGFSGYTATAEATTAIPQDPTALTATTVSASRIDLTWTDNSDNELRFIISRCNTNTCDDVVTVIDSVSANVTSYSDLGAVVDTVYGYYVQARNAAGTSGPTPVVEGSTLRPAAPTPLTVAVTGPTTATLSWSDNSAIETRFVIDRCAGAGCGAFSPIDSVAAGVVTFADASVVGGETYTYRVRAANAAGSSNGSNTTEAVITAPADPSGLTAVTLSESQIALSWSDNSVNETAFLIERCTGAGCSDFAVVDSTAAGVNSATSADLVIGNSYTFRVRAKNGVGTSAGYTNEATATTLLPADATGLTATVLGPARIALAWVDNANNEDGYRIERCIGAGCSTFVEIAVLGPDAAAYENTGLSLNNVYVYRVRPYNAVGPAGYTNEATENTLLPAVASNLTATPITVNQVDLAWTDNSDNETGFLILACEMGNTCDNFQPIDSVGPNVTAYSHATDPNTGYKYRVRPFRTPVGFAAPVESPVASTILVGPTNAVAHATSSTAITLYWTDNSDIETGYQIFGCGLAGCTPFDLGITIPANSTSFTYPSPLSPGISYSWQVRAVSNSTITALTPPAGAWIPQVLSDGVTVTGVTDTASAERNYVINVPAGTPELRVLMTPGIGSTGDADLYVRQGAVPTYGDWTCRPFIGGNTESCVITDPVPGQYFIQLQGFGSFSNVSIKASLATRAGFPTAFANTTNGWSGGYILAQQITVPRAITVTHLGLITPAGAGAIQIALYSNRVGGTTGTEPGNLVLATGGAMAPGLQEYATPNTVIAAGTYWIATNWSQFNYVNFNAGGAMTTWKYIASPFGTAFPAVWPASTDYPRENMNYFVRGFP